MIGRTICLDQLEFRRGRELVGCASEIAVVERPQAKSLLEQRDWEALRAISRRELERRFTEAPGRPAFVNPQVTIVGVQPDDLFYAEVERRNGWWHRDLDRSLSNMGRKRLAMEADWATKSLVFHGTLMVNGLIFLPGLWPNHPLQLKKLKRTPFGRANVSPEYLGLKGNANDCPREHDDDLDDARSH